MLRKMKNSKGIALVTSLMFTLISLVICMSLLYMITAGVRTSGAYKRYKTALDASYGGTDIVVRDLIGNALRTLPDATTSEFNTSFQGSLGSLSNASFSACLQMRLNTPSRFWTGNCANPGSNPKTNADISFNLNSASGQPYTVYSKIVDTREWVFTSFSSSASGVPVAVTQKIAGNTDRSSTVTLSKGSTAGSDTVKVPHYPYTYKIDIQGERSTNANEKANISVLYAY